jgi:hypothetical protein
MWWTEGDLNPRLPLCESGDHTGLIYRPVLFSPKMDLLKI